MCCTSARNSSDRIEMSGFTMYVDKPMQGHGLMQAIARVNRVFRDKPGGLVVDYLGLADQLKRALQAYTEGGGQGETALDQAEAVAVMIERFEVCCDLFHIFAAAGLKNPDISILSDQFLAEVRGMKHKNLAVELLRKLLNDEVKGRSRQNLVQARSFADLLEKSVRRYQIRAIEAAQVIEELIELAKQMRAAQARGEDLGLNDDELAFYDALEVNDSAVKVLGDATLKTIARELVETVRKNVTIDWTVRDNVRAQLRVYVKRILLKHGYPPDKQEKANQTVLEQAEVLTGEWAGA